MIPKIKLPKKPTIEKISFALGAYEIFERLLPHFENCFLLESLTDAPESRYSIIGFDPELLVRGNRGSLTVGAKKYKTKNPYELLQHLIPQDIMSRSFAGGLVGYVSYGAAEFFEPSLSLKQRPGFDRFCFGLYTDGLVFDKLTGETDYFYYRKNRLKKIQKLIALPEPDARTKVTFRKTSISKSVHARMVKAVQQEIQKGNTFQTEVGLSHEYSVSGSYFPIYEKLRDINPSPHMYYMKFGKKTLLGASPELLLDLTNGELQTFPLAGTVPRGENAVADQVYAKKLLSDPKERAEHVMLVDLHRNGLGKVSRFGTVKVRRFLDVKKFSHVQHLSSEITGLIALGEDMFSALASVFPAGTLSGAPKIESMKIIGRNESVGRGPYGGAVGFFGLNGNCTFAIPIRSLFASGSSAYAQASGGIVYDSKASNEYDEIERKLRATHIVLDSFK